MENKLSTQGVANIRFGQTLFSVWAWGCWHRPWFRHHTHSPRVQCWLETRHVWCLTFRNVSVSGVPLYHRHRVLYTELDDGAGSGVKLCQWRKLMLMFHTWCSHSFVTCCTDTSRHQTGSLCESSTLTIHWSEGFHLISYRVDFS